MARYIDADALYKKTAEWESLALAQVKRHMNDDGKWEWLKWSVILQERSAFKFDVADTPTADVVEVVRCKECIHHKEHPRPIPMHVWCERIDGLLPTDWFCADGERRK